MKGILLISACLYAGVNVIFGQVIPGLSPSKPNRLLKTCMSQSGPLTGAPPYNNQPANSVSIWCRSYENALPCVRQYLPAASRSDPNDWYLSLVYDEDYANETSRAVCSRLKKYGNKMGCLSADMVNAETCVSMLTSPVASHMHKTFRLNQTADVGNENSLRACLIPLTASRCFKQFFKTCRKGIKKLLAKYFLILGGKCIKIAEQRKQNTTLKPTDDQINQTVRKTEEDSDETNKSENIDQEKKPKSRVEKTTENKPEEAIQEIKQTENKQTEGQNFQKEETIEPKFSNNDQVGIFTQHDEHNAKLRIIQRVIHSDIKKESENTDQKSKQFTIVPVRHVITVNEPFTQLRNDIMNNAQTTPQPTRQMTDLKTSFIQLQSGIQKDISSEEVSEEDNERFIKPKIVEKTTILPTKDITGDIYIGDSQVLSAMKPLSEEQINHPDEKAEANAILSTFGNNTESSESDEQNENELSTDNVANVPMDPTAGTTTIRETDVVANVNMVPTTVTTTTRGRAENEDSSSEEDADIVSKTVTTPRGRAETEDSGSEEDMSNKNIFIAVTTTPVLTTKRQVILQTTRRTMSSNKRSQSGKSHGLKLYNNCVLVIILTFLSSYFNNNT